MNTLNFVKSLVITNEPSYLEMTICNDGTEYELKQAIRESISSSYRLLQNSLIPSDGIKIEDNGESVKITITLYNLQD